MKRVALPYPDTLNTLGDHIRKKRLDLGLYQKDVAQRHGVTTDSVAYWVNHRNQLSLVMIPHIIEFLGYVPDLKMSDGESLGKRIARVRRVPGIRQKDLRRQLGVDSATLVKWERQDGEARPENRQMLEKFFRQDPSSNTSESNDSLTSDWR